MFAYGGISTSVEDPFHFDTDPDPRIRFVEKRIHISPKIEKIPIRVKKSKQKDGDNKRHNK